MMDEVIVAAKIYADHHGTCQICANPGPVCCADGEALLEDFRDALNKGGILVCAWADC